MLYNKTWLVGIPGSAAVHGHCWVQMLEKCLYLDFLKVGGGTEGGL